MEVSSVGCLVIGYLCNQYDCSAAVGLYCYLSHENVNKLRPNSKDYINYDLSSQQYNSLIRNQQKSKKNLNLSNHQIYLPPPPTISKKSQSNFNFSSNESEDTFSGCRSPAATLIHGSICNCVNIASCSRDKLDGFLHSKDCHLNMSKNVSNKSKSCSEFGIQREHF